MLSNKNKKLEKARQVIDDLLANIVCYSKHQQNLQHKSNRNGFWQMFNGGKTELPLHNRNEEARKFQEGGTVMIVYGDLIQQVDPEGSGRDDLGLGLTGLQKIVRPALCCLNTKIKRCALRYNKVL